MDPIILKKIKRNTLDEALMAANLDGFVDKNK